MTKWQPIETAPHGKTCLIFLKDQYGHQRIIKAEYCDKFSWEAYCENFEEEWCDWNEDAGSYYYPEGWYETCWYHNDISGMRVTDTPTHWQPLPEPPSAQ